MNCEISLYNPIDNLDLPQLSNKMFVCLFLVAAFHLATAEIPRVDCNVKDRQFKQCLETSFKQILPQLTLEGVPELNISPIDPLDIKVMEVQIDSKLVKGLVEVTNTVIKGLSGIKFKKFKMEPLSSNTYKTSLKAVIPQLLVEGDYDADIMVTNLKIKGQGHYVLRLKKLDLSVIVHKELISKQDGDYFKVSKVSVHTVVAGFKLNATMDNNPKLAQMGVNMINAFWPVAFKQVYPYFAPHVEQIVLDHLKEYFDQVPIYTRQN